jgi:hypothetical protein
MKSLAAADRHGLARYVANQTYYSLIGRDYEWELMPLGLDAPLPETSRLHDTARWAPPVDDERLFRVLEALGRVARDTGHTAPPNATR